MRAFRSITLIALASLLIYALGCGTSGVPAVATSTAKSTYLYVGEASNPGLGQGVPTGAVAQFQVNNDNSLTQLGVSNTGSVLPLATGINPSNEYFFALDAAFGISELGIDGNGQLATVPSPTVTGSTIGFTPNGRFALIANPLNSTFSSYEINASGALASVSTLTMTNQPVQILVDPSGRFVYAIDPSGYSTIQEYSITDAAVLTPTGALLTGGIGSFGLIVSPTGFFYCVNPNSRSVSEFSMDPSTGLLTLVHTYPNGVAATGGPVWIGIAPNGKHAYAGTAAAITEFEVDAATGTLTSVNSTPTNNSYLIAMDPLGTHLYTSDSGYSFSTFVIGSNGALTPGVTVQLGGTMQSMSFAFAQR